MRKCKDTDFDALETKAIGFAMRDQNARIVAENAARAVRVPPLLPLPLLTVSTYMDLILTSVLDGYHQQRRAASADTGDSKRLVDFLKADPPVEKVAAMLLAAGL